VSLRTLLLALSTRRELGAWMARRPLTRRFVERFVAGTEIDDALRVLDSLHRRGFVGAVTYLGENVANAAGAGRAADVYRQLLDEIGRRGLSVLPSLKLTHLGLDLGEDICRDNVSRVLERATTRVWIDMESSAYTDRTLELHARFRAAHRNVACVVQAYLRRTPADLERLIALGAAVRLCKGAYREPPARAFPNKREVDAAYRRLADRLLAPDALAGGVYPGFATHDPRMIGHVRELVGRRAVGRDRFEFQMLYGIRPELAAALREQGFVVRVLVPFGEDWYGYFMRRLAERPANLLFLLRNL
jgi:proline dehydrogenase